MSEDLIAQVWTPRLYHSGLATGQVFRCPHSREMHVLSLLDLNLSDHASVCASGHVW